MFIIILMEVKKQRALRLRQCLEENDSH